MSCPIDHSSINKTKGECPIDHSKYGKELNPKNNMPNLSQEMSEGQRIKLSTQREQSGIPKSATTLNDVWEYPSSQVSFGSF